MAHPIGRPSANVNQASMNRGTRGPSELARARVRLAQKIPPSHRVGQEVRCFAGERSKHDFSRGLRETTGSTVGEVIRGRSGGLVACLKTLQARP